MSDTVIRLIIVDDEFMARSIIKKLLLKFGDVRLVGEFENGELAMGFIKENSIDLIFLDIEMPDLNGFELLKKVQSDKDLPLVVVTTAYKDYALPAFDLNVFDYLLKPFDQERFDRTMINVLKQVTMLKKNILNERIEHFIDTYKADFNNKKNYPQRITIKKNDKIYLVSTDDVDWISGEGDYIKLHCNSAEHLLNDSLKNIITRLDPSRFLRIHKSIIVNVDSILEFKPYFNGEYYIVLKNGIKLKSGRTYTEKIKSFFNF